jgi:aspartate kinase
MRVLKFGGTSVGTAEKMKAVAALVTSSPEKKIVVLSAMSGTTNLLVEIANCLYRKQNKEANSFIDQLEKGYDTVVRELYATEKWKEESGEMLRLHFSRLRAFTQDLFTIYEERAVLALGELISTALFHFYLSEIEQPSVLLPALNFMRIDKDLEPDDYYIRMNLEREMESQKDNQLFITQGFICRNAFGEIDNLKRGGSDYTASIIGALLKVDEIQIWTDIDGFHNNDPRIVENTKAIRRLSFDEAAELAYFGAKILHPSSVLPAKMASVPVRLKNTMQPEAEGTLLTHETEGSGVKAVAAKNDITAIKIKSDRMLLAYGFMRKVFEVFECYHTSIDLITTSEVAVSLTIDNPSSLDKIVEELRKFGTVEVETNQTIVCVVGHFISESKGAASQIFDALKNIPIRMISYGGSKHNISLLIASEHKQEALRSLHQHFF